MSDFSDKLIEYIHNMNDDEFEYFLKSLKVARNLLRESP